MSSTNRLNTLDNPLEIYSTPHWVVEKLLAHMLRYEPSPHAPTKFQNFMNMFKYAYHEPVDQEHGSSYYVLDPCCGGTESTVAPYVNVISQWFDNAKVDSMDIDEDANAQVYGNFLTTNREFYKSNFQMNRGYNLIISNPPFAVAPEFVEHGMKFLARDHSAVIMLQRLNWLGSKKRTGFWGGKKLAHIFVESKKISFKKSKKSSAKNDSIEYGHFVFVNSDSPIEYPTFSLTDW